jgi:hypothetical protein
LVSKPNKPNGMNHAPAVVVLITRRR